MKTVRSYSDENEEANKVKIDLSNYLQYFVLNVNFFIDCCVDRELEVS